MKRVLKAVGCTQESATDLACDALHTQGVWADSVVTIRLFAIGESRVDALPIPKQQQLTWDEVVDFCVKRFKAYQREKSSVGQWPEDGKKLQADSVGDSPQASIRRSFSLHAKRGPLEDT